MNATTLYTIQGTVEGIRYMVEPVVNDPTTTSLLETTSARIYDFFDRTTQSSFEAWEKSGKSEQF